MFWPESWRCPWFRHTGISDRLAGAAADALGYRRHPTCLPLGLRTGLAINLGGGYHHASGNRGGGFCVYADVPLALQVLRQQGKLQSVPVVDTDAHQGDGTADAIRHWPWAHILDFFEADIFPFRKVDEDVVVPLPAGLRGTDHLELLRKEVPTALDRYRPSLILHNAGSDVLETDPLARLRLTPEDLAERDLFVVTEVRNRGLPLAMVILQDD